MEDYIYDDDDENYYYNDDGSSFKENYEYSLKTLYSSCIRPSTIQISIYISTFILWNIIFRVTTQTVPLRSSFRHLGSITTGGILLYFTVGYSAHYLIFYTIITYSFLLILIFCNIKKFGYLLGIFCIGLLVLCELLETDPKIWHQIRGTQMIVAMKLISLGFDIDSGRLDKIPNLIELLGYTLCPANSVIGPWVPYTEYASIFVKPKWNIQWTIRIVVNTFFAIFFLILSNCVVLTVIPEGIWKWLTAYRDALSFRASHYFISYLSQLAMVTAGFGKQIDSYLFGYQITKPALIEIPRSIVQVVVAWNIPMHNWLKFYVFRNLKNYGMFFSIITTYIVSALLHGLNFQLSAVLLSLGFYTYIEYKLRKKLSCIFNACILSNKCSVNCQHEFKLQNFYVKLINFIFGILATLHLTYLGVMFEASTNIQEEGFSLNHAMNKWQSLDFTSHWIAGLCFIFYVLI